MPKFLTPPVWYDRNGSEINIFNNTSVQGGIAIGQNASVTEPNVIQLGSNYTRYRLTVGDGYATINGYIREGIAVPSDLHQGFEDVTYIADGALTKKNVFGGMYVVRVEGSSGTYRTQCSFLFDIYPVSGRPIYSPLFKWNTESGGEFAAVVATQVPDGPGGIFTLGVIRNVMSSIPTNVVQDINISVRLISELYPVG